MTDKRSESIDKSPCCGAEFPYVYMWGNNPKRATLKGRRCRVEIRGPFNSALVQFENGEYCNVSRNALRKHHEPVGGKERKEGEG